MLHFRDFQGCISITNKNKGDGFSENPRNFGEKKHAFVNYQKYSSLFCLGTLILKTRMTTSTEAVSYYKKYV